MKFWKVSFYFLGLFPWAFIVSLLTFYLKSAQVLGHAPSYNNPDPKELDFYSDFSPLVNWSGEIWFYSFIAWVLLSAIYIIAKRRKLVWAPLLFSSIGQASGLILVFSGILEWYID